MQLALGKRGARLPVGQKRPFSDHAVCPLLLAQLSSLLRAVSTVIMLLVVGLKNGS